MHSREGFCAAVRQYAPELQLHQIYRLAGTIPRNLLFAADLRFYAAVPWAVPLTSSTFIFLRTTAIPISTA